MPEENIDYSRGSEWRIWDLHVHSPLSFLNNSFPKNADGSADWEPYLQKLEASDISVVGVTDYFSLAGYKKLREFKSHGRLSNIECLLPNIEFRLEQQITRSADNAPHRVNFHVIFSDDLDPAFIEENFLRNLDFWYEAEPQRGDNRLKVTQDNLKALGLKLIQENPDAYEGRSALDVGASTAVVDHKQITKILTQDPRFRGKYLLALPESDLSLIGWQGQFHSIRQVLLTKADLVLTSNAKSRSWCLGLPPYEGGPKGFVAEFKTLKPCVHGSDAHDVLGIGRPCGKRGDRDHSCDNPDQTCDLRFCWIKADPTFEGLRQILYEPETRVRIQPADPTVPKPLHTLSEIRITGAKVNDELTVGSATISLNQDLIAIAGGKGNGKTALVDLLANCFMNRVDTQESNSFVARIAGADPAIGVSLSFANEAEFSKSLRDPSYFEEDEIVYIPQAALEGYVGKSSDLTRHIDALIMDSPLVVDTVLKFEYSKLASELTEVEDDLEVTSKRIESLERSANDEREKDLEKNLKRHQTDLGDVVKKLEDAEKGLTKESVEAAKAEQQKLSDLRTKLSRIEDLQRLIREALDFLEEGVDEFNEIIREINTTLTELDEEGQAPEFQYEKETLRELKNKLKGEGKKTAQEIERQTTELKQKAADVERQAKSLDQRKQLEGRIEKTKKELAGFEGLRTRLGEERDKRKELMFSLINAVLERSKKYREIIEKFAEKKDRVLVDLTFEPEILFQEDQFLENAEQVLDNRRAVVRGSNERPSDLVEYVRLSQRVAEEHTEDVEPLVEEAERLSASLRKKLKSGKIVTQKALNDMLFQNYFLVKPRVKYKKVVLEKCSLGQKATVLIKIHLAGGTKPIVIDSHDDHLDNEFIMEELVAGIRQAKEYRQVILVSNNGNVVVNSDAEQVIIAERHGTTIQYRSGSIENQDLRQTLLKVLEGGEKAFRQRQEKYRLGR